MANNEALERQRIREVILRYSTAIDTEDWDLFRTCFTTDCAVSYGNGRSVRDVSVTLQGIEELVAFMDETHQHLDGSLHRMTNIVIDLVDDEHAICRTYGDSLLVQHHHPDGPIYHTAGHYDDEFVKVEDEWAIQSRSYSRLVGEGNLSVTDPAPQSPTDRE